VATRELIEERATIGHEWMTREDAARFLSVTETHLTNVLRNYLRYQSASKRSRGPQNVGYVYSRADLERVLAIMVCVGCTAHHACVTLRAIRVLDYNQKLAYIRAQLDLSIGEISNHAN
jgi:hypothetical protein